MTPSRWTRRRVLTLGLAPAAVLACAAAGGTELVARGILPGRALLDEFDGACSVPEPPLAFSPLGPSVDGRFYSAARRRTVGYTIAYPPGHHRGDELPLVVMLHGYGRDHADALAGMSPAQALALKPGGRPLPPMALVTVDGGGYWNPHPGDDPMAMVVGELIPRCRRLGLGRHPVRIAAGYGDPFYPGVRALARALPPGAVVAVGPGCHDGSFFTAQEPPSPVFLAGCLTS